MEQLSKTYPLRERFAGLEGVRLIRTPILNFPDLILLRSFQKRSQIVLPNILWTCEGPKWLRKSLLRPIWYRFT